MTCLKLHCERINNHLDLMIQSLQFEDEKLNQNVRRRRGYGSSIFDAFWKSGSYGSYYAVGSESEARAASDVILRESIEKTYEDFLNHAKVQTKFNKNIEIALSNMDKNLHKLNQYAKSSSESFARIADEINDIKEYQISNRIWILFHSDLINIQRLLIN